MCRISYEKCVCFIFLVILAVLSCSGFRIDNLAMTDVSKRNSHTSTSLLDSSFFEKLFSVNATAPTLRHRIRHHRQSRAQAHTPQPYQHFAHQIPATDFHPNPLSPTKPIRSQRSNDRKGNRRQNICPDHDVSWKAYKANAIVIAKVESKSFKCRDNCTVFFKVVEILKKASYPIDDRFRLKFSSDRQTNCDELSNRSQFLVRTKIDQSKEYVLFLNVFGAHNVTAVFAPEIRRNRTLNVINRVISPSFKLRQPRLQGMFPPEGKHFREKSESHPKLKLVCRVKGFPIPTIYWKRNNTLLHPNQRQRITVKNSDGKDRRKSTLVIRNVTEADSGNYTCIVRGVDGNETSRSYNFQSSSEKPIFSTSYNDTGRPCDEPLRSSYCYNGGSCFLIQSMEERMCVCEPGFTGLRCQLKTSDQSSMYRQTPIYTCKIGLYTKYDKC